MTSFESKIKNLNEELINKMLEKYGVNYNYVLVNKIIEGKPWYQHYTMTMDERENFRLWAVEKIRKSLRVTRAHADHEFRHFELAYGLKIEDDGQRLQDSEAKLDNSEAKLEDSESENA